MDVIAENPEGYPESSMFGDLPAWGIYIRHAKGIRFKNLSLSVTKPDFRTAIVLDDVHQLSFEQLKVAGTKNKKVLFSHHSSGIISHLK